MNNKKNIKHLWKEYYLLENSIIEYINNNSILLKNDSTKEFDSFEFRYIRKIFVIEDSLVINELEKNLKKLKNKYLQLSGKSDTNRLSKNFPTIIKNVHSINININEAWKSIQINRHNKKNINEIFELTKFFESESISKKIFKLKEKYNLILNKRDIFDDKNNVVDTLWTINIKGEDILNITNADIVQLHYYTGNQYLLNIRKVGENRSKRYKYGVTVLDCKAIINSSNKEAKRTHTLDNIYGQFEFEFNIVPKIFIKEKRTNQMSIF